MKAFLFFILGIAVSGTAFLPVSRALASEDLSMTWIETKLPEGSPNHGAQMAVEPGGVPWLRIHRDFHVWDGKQFQKVTSPELEKNHGWIGFVGGRDRPLYAVATVYRKGSGRLYKLEKSEIEYVTDFHYLGSEALLSIHVTKSGQILNWGNRFLSVFHHGEWHELVVQQDMGPLIRGLSMGNSVLAHVFHWRMAELPGPLSSKDTLVFDTGDSTHLYFNRNLHSIDKDGKHAMREIPGAPVGRDHRSVAGTLWGNDRTLIFDQYSNSLFGYDLGRGRKIDTSEFNAALEDTVIYCGFHMNGGSVLLIVNSEKHDRIRTVKITKEGDLITQGNFPEVSCVNDRIKQFPDLLLNASDGSIFYWNVSSGINRYKDGQKIALGWQQGLDVTWCQGIYETAGGRILVLAGGRIYVLAPGEPPEVPAWAAQWKVFPSRFAVQDTEGNIWTFLKDRPKELSRWDGEKWEHTAVPFDTSKVSELLVDDRGHAFVLMYGYGNDWYEVRVGRKVAEYDDFRTMVELSVTRDMKEFDRDCIILDDYEIWLIQYRVLHHYDGKKWEEVDQYGERPHLFESAEHDFLQQVGGKFYAWDDGEPTEIEFPNDASTRWLLEAGFMRKRPFDGKLLEQKPGKYVPVEWTQDRKQFLLAPAENDDGTLLDGMYIRGDKLSVHSDLVRPCLQGGYFLQGGGSTIYRILGDRSIPCSFGKSPVSGRIYGVRGVMVDRKNNLWINAGMSGEDGLFMKSLDGFKISGESIPDKCQRSVTIDVNSTMRDPRESWPKILWRYKNGVWHGGESSDSVTIWFSATGRFDIELIGMGPNGELTPETVEFTIDAEVKYPETGLTSEGPYVAKELSWLLPAKIVPSGQSEETKLVWRMDGGDWSDADPVPLGELKAGKYTAEIAAKEGRYLDRTPLKLELTYEPDLALILRNRLDDLTSEDHGRQEKARREIASFGMEMKPFIDGELEKSGVDKGLERELRFLLQVLPSKYRLIDLER